MTPVALGKVLRARSEGNDIPESWGFLDRDGNPTIDPDVAMKGIVPAIGGYKGIGMITASNILAGILSGSAHTGEVAVGHRGQFFLLMDPNIFREKDDYYDDIENMVDQIRAAGEEDALPAAGVSARRDRAANYGPSFSAGCCFLSWLSGQSITPSGRRCWCAV